MKRVVTNIRLCAWRHCSQKELKEAMMQLVTDCDCSCENNCEQ